MGRDAYYPTNQPQQISVEVDLLAGPYHQSIAERVRRSIIEELPKMGTEITAVHIHINGQMTAW
jgi:hypothetical protein